MVTPGRPWASRPEPPSVQLPPPDYSLIQMNGRPLTQGEIDRFERQRLGLPPPAPRIDGGYLVAWTVTLVWLVLILSGALWLTAAGR